MYRLVQGAKIEIRSIEQDRIWFLPAAGDIVESMTNLRGQVVRCQLEEPIPLRNTQISQLVLLVGSNLECEVYMALSASLTMDPILHLGMARVA